MILEMRTYTLHPGKMAEYWGHYAEGGFAAQDPRLAHHLVGYFQSDLGTLNQVVHLWGFESLADMETRRNARDADPAWQDYLERSEGLVVTQENKLARPTEFSGIR